MLVYLRWRMRPNACCFALRLLLTPFVVFLPITVKSNCWMEKMSTTNYCQPPSQSPRRRRTAPPPALSSGPLVSQSWALQPCQPVRQQTHQTCRQTLQRTSVALDVLWYVEQVAAGQNERPVQAMPSALHPKWRESIRLSGLIAKGNYHNSVMLFSVK